VSRPFLAVVTAEQVPQSAVAEKRSAIADLFDRVRRGEVPRHRDLLPHEPQKLDEVHLQMVMARILGSKQCDIARTFNYTDGRVSVILNHPDSVWVMNQLQSFAGVEVTDIDSRLKRLSVKAVDAIEDAFDASVEEPKEAMVMMQKARLGFDLLARNGHGPKREVEHRHRHSLQVVDKQSASLIARALKESDAIEEAEYTDADYTVLDEIAPGGGVEEPGPPTALPSGTEAPPLGASQELLLSQAN
jgi:hypothetical protein